MIASTTDRPTPVPLPLMALFDGYTRERQPSPATIKRWRRVIHHLVEHLGHDDARRICADDIIGWKEALAAEGASGRTIREVYLAATKVVFAWSVENRKLVTNPAAGISVRVPIRRRTRGPSFTPIEARTILSGTLARDQGGISPEHALARRWIPWICAYSGARVGEIAQMRGCDILQIEGIWAMRITPEAGSTKNGQSRVVALQPHLTEQGLQEVSAWLTFTAIGFYPVAPGTNEYVIGRPFVDRATLNLPNGKRFVITARNLSDANRYVTSVRLNGQPLRRGYIRHGEITAGGTLAFRMGRTPNRSWAIAPADRPYSMSR